MKALIIGATGATGKDLVDALLKNDNYTEVVTFVRRAGQITHPKLSEIATNFDQLDDVSKHINGDVLFSCLGTTLKAAGSKEKQMHIDHDIPLKFAEIAKSNGVRSIVLLSAYGADANSGVFYSKIKGMLEDAITKLEFAQYIIFKPGLLIRKDTDRLGERISAGLLHFLNSLGLVKKFKPLPTATLAEKLAKAPEVLTTGLHTIELNYIFEL